LKPFEAALKLSFGP